MEILSKGGNAADAAVATVFNLTVSDYGSTCIGGEVPFEGIELFRSAVENHTSGQRGPNVRARGLHDLFVLLREPGQDRAKRRLPAPAQPVEPGARVDHEAGQVVAPGQPGLRVNVTTDEVVRYSPRKIDVINLETNTFETVEIAALLREFGSEYPILHQLVSIARDDRLEVAGEGMPERRRQAPFGPLPGHAALCPL